ncbi:Retrovirus-related Pol polyprotein from transposon TNT 1-94 [Vitis vinifera]|uniref:Retrovirus-related Pol polyprotein from transposon TNT 1-94 n=1 Tax=Vitis vinifera TaxID=29760 RepID=A0A438CN18_VITVI|nr:Retrovirus-related Pol polyprotein from transposon TNT 1-94 [Vitis vinifera]
MNSTSSIFENVNNIHVLNSTNFKKWKEHVVIVLGCMDLDYALREDRPSNLTSASTVEQRSTMEKWERSNCMSLMIMKHSIPEAIRGAILEETRAKAFLDQIANRFVANEKVETNTILSKLVSMRPFKISYNKQKEKWTLNELIAQCVQEEERLKQEKIESAHLASTSQGFGTNKKRRRDNKGKQTSILGHQSRRCRRNKIRRSLVSFAKSKKIKVVRSDRGGEYYGRYDRSGEQRLGPFAKYLMKCGIVPQYTMTGTPSQNGVAERQNCTLKDMILLETGNAKFIENVELSGREPLRKVVFEEESVSIPIITTGLGHIMFDNTIQNVQSITKIQDTPEIPPAQIMEPIQVHEEVTQQPQEPQVQVPLRRSTRERRSTILDDYVVYLQEHEFDMGLENDPILVNQVKQSFVSKKWIEAMKDKMKSMKDNGVWDIVELPEGVKPIGCKWIFKTKRDSKGNIVKYKARLVTKGFTQKEDIDYKETFSPVSSKDSFIIIMALVAHYDLELHQMNVKTAFLNGNIDETIYMVQPENFESNDSKQFVCRLKRSIGIVQEAQKAYINKVLSRFGKSNCALGDTLVAKDDKFSLHQCPKNELEKKNMERYLSNQGMDHWKKAKRVMRYLQRTKDYILTYRRSSHLEIVGYSDSDFAGCLDSRRSTLGYIFMLAGGAVSWKSVKQTLIASSTMEVEFIACYEASNHGIWMQNFITKLRIVDGIEKPLRTNCNNKAAELYSKNNQSLSKSKHIDIKFLVVKERVQSL